MQKVAVINGNNYIVASVGGSYQDTSIGVFSANAEWHPIIELAATSGGNINDFYVYTYPNVLNNTIIICGHLENGTGGGFIMGYNTANNSFPHFVDIPTSGYITQVCYISALNEFAITANGDYINGISMSTPANLFIPANWVKRDHMLTQIYLGLSI